MLLSENIQLYPKHMFVTNLSSFPSCHHREMEPSLKKCGRFRNSISFRLYIRSRPVMSSKLTNKNQKKLGNACYHSVQNIMSSSLLSKNLKIKIYSIMLLVVVYGCETWSRTLTEQRRLRMFENRVLRRVFGPKRDEVTGEWRKLHNEERGA